MNFVERLGRQVLRVVGVDKVYSDNHLGYLVNTLAQQVQDFHDSDLPGKVLDSSLLETKGSDTAFILGSGPSIGALSTSHFNEIAACDSFGFNFWPAHPFVPSHFVLQLSREQTVRESQVELLRSRRVDYGKSEILVRGNHTFTGRPSFTSIAGELFPDKDFRFLPELAIHSRVEINPRRMMEVFEFLGFLQHGVIGRAVPKWRSTLGMVVSLVYQMGYQNIVLCGVDMNDSTYFFDSSPYKEKFAHLDMPKGTQIKKFESAHYSRNTLSKYLVEFADFALGRSPAKIFLASPGSVLSGKFPDWKFNSS